MRRKIQALSPWFHDIHFPELNLSTHWLCGIDQRLLTSYDPHRFPIAYAAKSPLAELRNKRVLEIGPASGFYTLRLAEQGNDVVCVEQGRRFIEQIKFIRRHFKLGERISICRGTFPNVVPSGQFDVVWCLGVLHHVKDYGTFLCGLNALAAPNVYLEIMVSKSEETITAGDNEGYAFSEQGLERCLSEYLNDYQVTERINYTDSDNSYYNELPYYRCLLHLFKG